MAIRDQREWVRLALESFAHLRQPRIPRQRRALPGSRRIRGNRPSEEAGASEEACPTAPSPPEARPPVTATGPQAARTAPSPPEARPPRAALPPPRSARRRRLLRARRRLRRGRRLRISARSRTRCSRRHRRCGRRRASAPRRSATGPGPAITSCKYPAVPRRPDRLPRVRLVPDAQHRVVRAGRRSCSYDTIGTTPPALAISIATSAVRRPCGISTLSIRQPAPCKRLRQLHRVSQSTCPAPPPARRTSTPAAPIRHRPAVPRRTREPRERRRHLRVRRERVGPRAEPAPGLRRHGGLDGA